MAGNDIEMGPVEVVELLAGGVLAIVTASGVFIGASSVGGEDVAIVHSSMIIWIYS